MVFEHGPQVLLTVSQTIAPLHPPQFNVPPQPSARVPQRPAQVSGLQVPHWFVAPSQTSPKEHAPQSTLAPQASTIAPHSDCAHAWAVLTHCREVASQTSPLGQTPHAIVLPQPSETGPHVAPTASHVLGTQPELPPAPTGPSGTPESESGPGQSTPELPPLDSPDEEPPPPALALQLAMTERMPTRREAISRFRVAVRDVMRMSAL